MGSAGRREVLVSFHLRPVAQLEGLLPLFFPVEKQHVSLPLIEIEAICLL
jgi:hypothetical protein